MDAIFSFNSDETLDNIYSHVAYELKQRPDRLMLYLAGNRLIPLVDREVQWCNLDGSSSRNTHFLAITLADGEIDVRNPDRVLLFIAGYIPTESPPLQFFYWELASRKARYASLLPRFQQYCRMETYVPLRVYIAEANDSVQRVDLEDSMTDLVDGTILVIHPDEPYTWNYVPIAIAADDDDESETDESEEEGEEHARTYRPSENPWSFKKYLELTKDVITIHIESPLFTGSLRFRVPRCLPIDEFYAFIGSSLDPSFRVETHTIIFYHTENKHPFEFRGNQVGPCVSGPRSQLRFTVFLFVNIDAAWVVGLVRLRVLVDGMILNLVTPPETKMSEMAEMCAAALHITEPVRVIAFRDRVVDGIYCPETQVRHIEVRNPLILDRIPPDQQALGPSDKLVAVSYIRHREDVKPDLEPIDTGYLRVTPGEAFVETRTRLKEFGHAHASFTLESGLVGHSSMNISAETVLWDVIDDLSILKVIFRQAA
jgi:hypothetical protein